MILRNFISLQAFAVYMENSLRFEICTEVSFTSPEVMWTQVMKLPYTEVKSQIGLSSLRVSCKRALTHALNNFCRPYGRQLIWAINLVIKSIISSFTSLNIMMENENNSFTNISIHFLRSCSHMLWKRSQEMDWNISKAIVFIFHHSIQYEKASGYTFYT